MSQQETSLSDWEKQRAKNAHHRALIMQILTAYPNGLTTQQIVEKELEFYRYTFLTDNRLRELRARNFVRSVGEKPQLWIKVNPENEQ